MTVMGISTDRIFLGDLASSPSRTRAPKSRDGLEKLADSTGRAGVTFPTWKLGFNPLMGEGRRKVRGRAAEEAECRASGRAFLSSHKKDFPWDRHSLYFPHLVLSGSVSLFIKSHDKAE